MKCNDGSRVKSVRFLASPQRGDDLRVIAMDCHGERMMITITTLELVRCVTDADAARTLIGNLCEMAYFKKADKLESAYKTPVLQADGLAFVDVPETSAERIKRWRAGSSHNPLITKEPEPLIPKEPEPIKRKDAPWNF
jgi:hypothetical protein